MENKAQEGELTSHKAIGKAQPRNQDFSVYQKGLSSFWLLFFVYTN